MQYHLPEPEKGAVIVDTCSLSVLVDEMDPQRLAHPEIPVRGITNLLNMAKCGYDIWLPEMVLLEAADTCHDGTYVFNERHVLSDKAAQRKELQKPVRIFFMEVLAGKHPHVHIIPAHDHQTSDAAVRVRAMRELSQVEDMESARRILTAKDYTKRDLGEIAAADIVENLPQDWSKPIFFLSDDTKGVDYLRKARPDLAEKRLICALSTKGYMQAFGEAELLHLMDIKPPHDNATTNEIANDMADNVQLKWGHAPSRSTPRTDTAFTYEEIRDGARQEHPFMKAVMDNKELIEIASLYQTPVAPAKSRNVQERKSWDKYALRDTSRDASGNAPGGRF